MSAAAYILKVPPNRREVLLFHEGDGRYTLDEPNIAEPVPRFIHNKRGPLVVLACFSDDAITHIADGRKGMSAGTGLVRLNMTAVENLEPPVPFNQLLEGVPTRVRSHVGRVFEFGGKLPPKSLGAVVDALLRLRPALAPRLARFSEQRADLLSGMTETSRVNLAVQKETVVTALKIAGIGTEELLEWSPRQGTTRSFLEGLPDAYVREDAVLATDFSSMPGFEALKTLPIAVKVFQKKSNPAVRLKVIMANRLPLEQQTGADLIYYNEAYQSFVLVQYKSMEHGSKGPEFRWQPNDKLADEISRMDDLLRELGL